ncbi:MAG TPA: hypothetical protein PKC60_09930 [Hydrogenophaga sp.]|uniref:hypothetical protein n=1 Tax=Hydrogenophaga sp. TaxID=1904254 RepID=UPI002BFAF997|nr:hypothetical protein [Hydrogenophaga sp.]HMN93537.1 hypothetical protein [Hydrogenophaga sp.]HMP10252.1 hypothetical protein [Hydrogenophaga sp.]
MRVVAIALFVLSLVAFGSLASHQAGPVWPALCLLLLAAPAGLFSTYLATLRRIRNMAVWSSGSKALAWLSGPWLRVLGGVAAAFVATAFLAPRVLTWQAIDGWLLALSALVFWGLHRWLMPKLQLELQPAYRFGWPLWWIAVFTALSMVPADLLLRHPTAPSIGPLTLAEAIDQAGATRHWLGTSALAAAVADWASLVRGLELHLIARAQHSGAPLGWLLRPLVTLTQLPYHLFVALSMAAFALPARELTRVLMPPQALDEPLPVPPHRLAAVASLLAVLVAFVFVPVVVMLESRLQRHDTASQMPSQARGIAIELIDGVPVQPGTAAELRHLQMEAARRQREAMQQVMVAYDDSFDRLRQNVERYPDWYYSLGAEYVRLFSAATGGLEAHLHRRLQDTLGAGDPFEAFQMAIDRAVQTDRQLAEDTQRRSAELLQSRRVDLPADSPFDVVGRFSMNDLQHLSQHESLTTLEQRFAVGGATGVVSALIARQVVMRMAARGTLRMAASTLSRAALARSGAALGGAGAGAATGAAVGSVIPGLGTATGAIVGGVLGGLGIGLGTEFLLLKTEELFRREAHRQAILESVAQLQGDLAKQLGLEARPHDQQPPTPAP